MLELHPALHRLLQLGRLRSMRIQRSCRNLLRQVLLLLVGIEQFEDPLCRCNTGDEHVGHARHLPQRRVELARVLDEGSDLSQRHLARGHAQPTHQGDAHVTQIRHPLHDRHDHPGVELSAE